MDRYDPLPLIPNACHQAINILEILERILFLVPPAQLLSLRFVSHHWDRATYRPLWQYPDFTERGMVKITPRLVEHGHIVQELDFYKASLFSENPLEDVETLKRWCPNVRSLRMRYGCLTFAGVQHLIQFYGLKAAGPWTAKPGEGGQLHSLSLDMSKTEYQPSGMEWLTDLGKGLKRLELRINRKREGSTRQRTSFLQFEPLLEACQGLRELDIIPTPHFLPSSDEKFRLLTQGQQQNNFQTLHAQLVDTIHGAAPKFRTSDSLKYFEMYKPPLRRLHLARVWFSDMDLEVLARACPEIDDLRLTNMRMDLAVDEWNVQTVNTPLEWEDRAKDELSIEVVLKCWPGMRTLRLDGNVVRMFSAATRRTSSATFVVPTSSLSSSSISQTGSEAMAPAEAERATIVKADSDMTASAAKVTPASAGLLPKGSYKLASLCLYQTSLLEDDLVTLVDLMEPTLTYLNVDGNPNLTDQSIRHVLMTCSNLRDFSASELNLTMGVFEDYDPHTMEMQRVSEKIQTFNLEGESSEAAPVPLLKNGAVEPATKRPWACIETLRSLDFSWRARDGQPAYVESTRSSTVISNENFLPPYRHHTHLHRQQQQLYNAQGSSASVEAAESTSVRMFRTPWHIESLYERLRALERLEVLQLEGWAIPWRAADIEAFLGHSPEPELISKENQFQEDKISYLPWERYKVMGRWKEAASLKEYVDADFAYVASQSAIVKERLRFKGPSKDGSSWMASPGLDGLRVEKGDILLYPRSRMGRLKLLNIMCKRPIFLENPIGEASPFVLCPTLPPPKANKSRTGGAGEESAVEESSSPSTPSAVLSPVSPVCTVTGGAAPPPPPPPPPCSGFVPRHTPGAAANNSSASTTGAPPTSTLSAPSSRPIPISPPPRRDPSLAKILAHGVVASFMKACPQLERVLIATERSASTNLLLTDFTVQLGCSEESEAVVVGIDEGEKEGEVAILNDPAVATLRVSPRRVLCTRRVYPELTSLRRY
ncbi:hypothetical protein EC957_012170 [Mortierella hygrophila]|uniref:F-box domain-containing protein n=1 Tax=Mortierella hygrophila TaxID=979708 RepID=A0A9P6F7X5_9FUNG|nr:hypothetical protein EC957_012170 [Mortierella hygrophila]